MDNEDLLGEDYLGLDPVSFFRKDFNMNGEIMIGRCTCGVEGCADYPVSIGINENSVSWKNSDGLNLLFEKSAYQASINAAKSDHSWEDIKRRIERLISDMLTQTTTKDGYKFDWASARIKDNQIELSYSKDHHQKLFSLDWDGQTESNAIASAEQFLKKEHIK